MSTESLDDALRAAVEPVRVELERIEHEMRVYEEALSALREQRRRAQRVLTALEGEKKKPSPKPSTSSTHTGISAATLAEIEGWLESHRDDLEQNGGTFSTPSLKRRSDYPFSEQRTSAALRVLHDRGLIVLAGRGSGGRKDFSLLPLPGQLER